MVLPGGLLHVEPVQTRDRLAFAAANHAQAAIGEIERDVAVLGENAHLPLGAGGDTAGGDRGHRARGEADTRVGDVLVRARDSGADRIHPLDRAIDEGQHQVEVVDHQVQDHRHICAARLERGDAGGLDVKGRPDPAGQCAIRGGETFQMADLENKAPFIRQSRHLVGFSEGGGDGFFHQHVLARYQGGFRDREVHRGRHRDDQRVARLQQLGERKVSSASLGGNGAGALRVSIVHAGQPGARRGSAELERVIAAEMPGAGNADAKGDGGHVGLLRVACLDGKARRHWLPTSSRPSADV